MRQALAVFSATLVPALLFGARIARAVTIPFQLDANNRVLIPCSYGGLRGTCGFDSGARMNDVALNTATEKLPVVGEDSFEGASGAKQSCDSVMIGAWSLGKFTVDDVRADRCEDDTASDSVGIGFFKGHSFSFDMSKSQIVTDIVIPRGEAQTLSVHPEGWAMLPISMATGGATEGSAGGSEHFEALWDTGADVSIIDQKLIEQYPGMFTAIQYSKVTDATGSAVTGGVYSAHGFKIGNLAIADFTVMASDFGPEAQVMGSSVRMILGRDLMQMFKWYMDLPHRRFALVPTTAAATDLADWPKNFGFTEVVKADGSTSVEIHEMNDVRQNWADIDTLVARMTHRKQALLSPEYISYREGASALLGPAVYSDDLHGDYDTITTIRSTPANPWLTLIQPETQDETNCLTISIVGGKLQGCGDVFQGGLTDDKLACFEGQTYLRCHLECMDSTDRVSLDFTPGRCASGGH